jgi:hypothetical protein
MAKDRSKDDKRSVGSHEKMMGALGKAAGGWNKDTLNGKPTSEKIIDATGEIKGVKLGKGHVYHPGTDIPSNETKLPPFAPAKSAYESYEGEDFQQNHERARPKGPVVKINTDPTKNN